MPKGRPATSGYARLAAEDEDHLLSNSDDEDPHLAQSSLSTTHGPVHQQPRRHARMHSHGTISPGSKRKPNLGRPRRSNSGVDIKAINARLERWADEIAQKFKIKRVKGPALEDEHPEIQHSVFQAPDWIRPATAETLETEYKDAPGTRLTKLEFDDIVESVRVAIELGTHPKLISQGSSGSYFARNADGKVVGVFKPKDEEPYASRNPKWTKWIHRNLFPFFFGRACLIPNLSYVSEAAAYVLDTQLRTNLVPYTDIISLSSKSFFYDYWDRRAYYRKRKPFPEKVGSLQIFLKGFKDANIFLKEHPWPDQQSSNYRDAPSKKRKRRWAEDCRPGGHDSDDEDGSNETLTANETNSRRAFWTDTLQQSFREQLEKLVILDYIMRNTDRGLDNWMIKIDQETQQASIVAEPPKGHDDSSTNGDSDPYTRQEPMSATSRSTTPINGAGFAPGVALGAIDNSLSWPWKHPDAWRSYPFGWLFLPVSLIGQPFSEATRQHFLPLLTSKKWWSDTQAALRRCFIQDSDFKERMYAKQIAVMKGQAWNVVETLKTPDHGPLELTRRARVCVWDDLVDVPVAVPLRVPSAEMRRRQASEEAATQSLNLDDHEEMDISAARASAPQPNHDLLGMSSPKLESNRFNLSRESSSQDVRESLDGVGALSPTPGTKAVSWTRETASPRPGAAATMASRGRMSYEGPRSMAYAQAKTLPHHRRRFSFSTRSSSGALGVDDDLEGDLGYSAAEDREGNRKRVIVERLETVKSKNPVFTWC
ncbi:hypothetical protein K402DRAFT_388198 [Aulographum hederae CBS 113979]|uniref:Phosphatidylinositol 4-kinase n=1 Tax=Aulographum hederae CBS 113979 TaxID=1176131 RepID=A0A6G1HH40_9PEZI|nr:hypothetical protein K402DRAFT_388198 [Aulographum hederae CBS 113979]